MVNSPPVKKVPTKPHNGVTPLSLPLLPRPLALSLLLLTINITLLCTVRPSKAGSLLLKLPTLPLRITEENKSLLLLLTRKLSLILPTTILSSRSVVNSQNLWPFHTAESLMLMVDTSVNHLHLSQLPPQSLNQLLQPPTPPRQEFLLTPLPIPPKLRLSGKLTFSPNLIHLPRKLTMKLSSRPPLVLPLLLLSILSPKPPMVL